MEDIELCDPSMSTSDKLLSVYDLGVSGYKKTLAIQNKIQQFFIKKRERISSTEEIKLLEPNFIEGCILIVEHPHTITIGKNGDKSHLLISKHQCKLFNIDFIHTDRGGDITYHGPNQLVVYPILDLRKLSLGLGTYLRKLEEIIIKICSVFFVSAVRKEQYTGVWVGDKKIAAIGIHCSKWITKHGIAFNINNNLAYFSYIIPCGLPGYSVTNLKLEAKKEVDIHSIKPLFLSLFKKIFQVNLVTGIRL